MQLVVASLGIFGNALTIFIFTRKYMRQSPINVLIAGLAAADLTFVTLYTVANLPFGFFVCCQQGRRRRLLNYDVTFALCLYRGRTTGTKAQYRSQKGGRPRPRAPMTQDGGRAAR